MSWSPQQEAAIKAVRQWLASRKGPQVFRLFGFAGSGKTTLAKEMAASVNGTVLFGAFTGKASLVLRQKGCHGASTIHSMIYKPQECPFTGITEFKLNHDSPVAHAALVIIDEVSMVGEDLAIDLLSYGTKVLVLGDPAQLPPVNGEGFFINATPDVMLTEIHRQAAENPIIRMSMEVREGGRLDAGQYGDSRVIPRAQIDKETMRELVLGADQLLCGLNKTRLSFNARIRELKGMRGVTTPEAPIKGDRLVCLRNNSTKGLFNGGLWEVTDNPTPGHGIEMTVRSLDEDTCPHVKVNVPIQFFTGREREMDWRELKGFDQFTYGYALTCHKSQGSQWPHPVVFDESGAFRQDRAKWLYTAITRASDRVTIIA